MFEGVTQKDIDYAKSVVNGIKAMVIYGALNPTEEQLAKAWDQDFPDDFF